MSREIKFRAWESGEGRMWSYEDIDASDKDGIVMWGELFRQKEDGFTLMQFTGLKDKNGVEIYDGDIVTYELHQLKHAIKAEDYPRPVNWSAKKAAWFFGEYSLGNSMEFVKSIEVIGNIHQHPELLKEKP